MQGASSAKGAFCHAFILSTLLGYAACLPPGGPAHCDADQRNVTPSDANFAAGPARAVAAATITASGTVSYSGRAPALPTSSTLSLDIEWDQSSVAGTFFICDDGNDRWDTYFTVPVTAKLSTADNLFSTTLTGTVKNAADGSRDLEIYFDNLALSDLHGTFSWRDVNGWSSESDVCADVRVQVGWLRLEAETNTLVRGGQYPGLINIECPSDTPPRIAFSAAVNFK